MTNKEDKYSFSFVNFDAHKPPMFTEVRSKEYIIFGAEKGEYYNNYPQYLLDNINRSSIHNAICNGKVNYIVGSGLKVSEFNTVNDLAMAKGLIRSVNSKEDADDLNRKLTTDLVDFGGFYVELIPDRKKELAELYHIDFNSLRRSKEDDKVWFYTADWSARKPENNEDWKVFHEFEGKFESGKEYILEYRGYRAGDGAYALPDYMAANAYIETDWRIANYLLNNVKNGFAAGYIINFYNGMPTEEEKRQIEKQIKSKFAGDDNGGSFVLNFNNAESKSAEIIPIPTNGNDDRFNLLSEKVNSNLFIAHSVTNPMLFGVKTAGQLGGRSELVEAFELFQNTYINNKQIILEKFWNEVLYIKGIDAKLDIVETTPFGEPDDVNEVAVALGNLSPLVATKILDNMSASEVRALIGLEGGKIEVDTTVNQFKSEDIDNTIIGHFNCCGVLDEELEVLESKDIKAFSIEEAESVKFNFNTLTDLESAVLDIIKDSPKMSAVEVSEVIDVPLKEVQDTIEELEKKSLITIDKDGNVDVTNDGEEENKNEVFTVYKYKLRDDAPSLVKGGKSRFFCKTMMNLSKTKSWTIEDIKRLRNGQGLDVFSSRGGYYRKPNTDISVPFCRHIWESKLVRRKKK